MQPRRSEQPRVPVRPGLALQGTLSHAGAPGPAALLYVHGFGSTRGGAKAEALAAACARRGWTFAAFDFRGHGGSDGTMLDLRGGALLEDLEAVRAYLAGRGVSRLFPVGSSMGGLAVAWYALRRRDVIPACVAVAPAFDFLRGRWARLSDAQREAWRRTGRLRVRNEFVDVELDYRLLEEAEQYRLENLAAAWATPLLIFHGMRDEYVPYTGSLSFVEQTAFADVELRLFKDGDHRLLAYKDEIAEAACLFFERRWPGGG